LKARPEADGGQPPARRLHRGNRSGRAGGYAPARIPLSQGCATAEGRPSQGARGKSEEAELSAGNAVNGGLRQHLDQGVHAEHITQVHEQLIDARLPVQHRNYSQAFTVIDAEISHLSELRAVRPRARTDTPPAAGNDGGGPPQRGDPPPSELLGCSRERQSLIRSLTTMVWSRSGPTPMAEKRVPESFSRART